MKPKLLEDKKALYLKARDQYYNEGSSLLTDADFDALEDEIRELDPKWKALHETGIAVDKKREIQLHEPMPSLDKVKSDVPEGVERWLQKAAEVHPEVHVSEKIDGSSIQGVWVKGKLKKLATRGDGTSGKDISGFIPYINLPLEIPEARNIPEMVVRFEAAMPIEKYLRSFQGNYDSDRALASAILNRQDVHPALRHIDFVALRCLRPALGVAQGLEWFKQIGFKVPRSKVFPISRLTPQKLADLTATLKGNSKYTLDGLVLFTCSQKKEHLITADRPKLGRAFKLNDMEGALETTIVDIVWNPSSFGIVVPKAIIKPIKFGNVTVKQAALHNPAWAKARGAGIGAKVKVIRSGDIIPKIVEVLEPAPLEIPLEKGTWRWDASKVNIELTDPSKNPAVLSKQFARFFSKLGLDDVALGLASKLVDAGYTSTSQLPHLTVSDLLKLPGVKSSAAKIARQLSRVQGGEFDVICLMMASGSFERGLGETRLDTLWSVKPELFDKSYLKSLGRGWKSHVESEASAVAGVGPVAAGKFAEGLKPFWIWVRESGACIKPRESAAPPKDGPLSGQVFSWTGYRDEDEENFVRSQGGQVAAFKLSQTTTLFYRVGGKASTKVDKARLHGIQTMTFDEFSVRKTKK